MNSLNSIAPLLAIYFGIVMPTASREAHPRGPEGREFRERTIHVQGQTMHLVFRLAYPKPQDIVDQAQSGTYVASNWTALMLRYEYQGHFWQGVFGAVTLRLRVRARPQDEVPWTDLDAFLISQKALALKYTDEAKGGPSESRQRWIEPSLRRLNGVACVEQQVATGNDLSERHYFFPLGENQVLDLSLWLVDNGDRPGLPTSDWRPRAEEFANKLLSTVQVRY